MVIKCSKGLISNLCFEIVAEMTENPIREKYYFQEVYSYNFHFSFYLWNWVGDIFLVIGFYKQLVTVNMKWSLVFFRQLILKFQFTGAAVRNLGSLEASSKESLAKLNPQAASLISLQWIEVLEDVDKVIIPFSSEFFY